MVSVSQKPKVHRYVRVIVGEDDQSLEQVVTDALNLLFRSRGKH